MPTPLAIALAVIGWSPVTIMTLIPALRHLLTASGTAALGGSIKDIKPTKQSFSIGKFGGCGEKNYLIRVKIIESMHQSVPSANIPRPDPRGIFKVVKFLPPGRKFVQNYGPGAKKANTQPNCVKLQGNFSMIVKPFALFVVLFFTLSFFESFSNIKLANTEFLSDNSIAQLRFWYVRKNRCLLTIRSIINTFTRCPFIKMRYNILLLS